MKNSELTQLYWLKKEIRLEEGRLRELDMEGGREADALWYRIYRRKERCAAQVMEMEGYIDSIDDSITRQIFVYRYAYGMNWVQIAHILGGGNTADGVKKRCQRWLAAHPGTCPLLSR